jgi:hypothetical protein
MSKPPSFAQISDLGIGDGLEDWRWLVGKKAQVRLLTAMGDLFIVKPAGWFGKEDVCLLDTCSGQQRSVSSDWDSFKRRMAAPDAEVSDWLKFGLLCDLYATGSMLSEGECFAPKIPPILGGKIEPSNFAPTKWRVHVTISGQIYRQVKDLPPGTRITRITVT